MSNKIGENRPLVVPRGIQPLGQPFSFLGKENASRTIFGKNNYAARQPVPYSYYSSSLLRIKFGL